MAKNPWIDFLSSWRKSHPKQNMRTAMKSAAVAYRKKKPATKAKGKKKAK